MRTRIAGIQPALALWALLLATPLAAQSRADIDALFRIQGDAPGCAVGVRHNGVVVHRAGYGMADIEHRVPISPSSVFYTGSVSKQFTALAVALAARDGAFGLDDKVVRWIPELPDVARDITVRQLVHHTGGLREKWDLLSMQGVPVATTLITQQMVLDLVSRQRGVNFAPGTRYAYNNTGYDMLATLIERSTGKSIRQFAEERIFGPLGMRASKYADRYGELIPNRVMGYSRAPDSMWMMAPAMVETVGSGSVYSSLDDLLAWVASWETGILGDSALQRQQETPGRLNDGTQLSYAWGLVVDQWNGVRRVQHGGSLAGYRTMIWRLPEQRWSGVILCNAAEATPDLMMPRLAALWFPQQRTVVQSASMQDASITVPPRAAIPADVVGEYWSDELQVMWRIAARDGGYWLSRGTVPDVQLTTPPGGDIRVGSWKLVFERNASGAVTGLEVSAPRSFGVAGQGTGGVRFGRRAPSS